MKLWESDEQEKLEGENAAINGFFFSLAGVGKEGGKTLIGARID